MVYEAINLHHPTNNWVIGGRCSGRSRWAGSVGVAPPRPRGQAIQQHVGANPMGVTWAPARGRARHSGRMAWVVVPWLPSGRAAHSAEGERGERPGGFS